MSDPGRLDAVKARRAALDPGHTCLDLDWLPSVDWLICEVDRLRIYEQFGQDHGHKNCIAEITRLREG